MKREPKVVVSFSIFADTNADLEEEALRLRQSKSYVAEMCIRRGLRASLEKPARRKRVA